MKWYETLGLAVLLLMALLGIGVQTLHFLSTQGVFA